MSKICPKIPFGALYHADLASLAVAGGTVMLTVDIYME